LDLNLYSMVGTDYHVLTKYTGLGERHWQTFIFGANIPSAWRRHAKLR
jgi:hypothetical protein